MLLDRRQINKYEEFELARVNDLHMTYRGRNGLNIRDFFPELKLPKPYTRLNLHPFWVGLPFYRTQIFDIYPFESETVLQGAHGTSVQQLLSLHDDGKIEFALSGPPYGYLGLDYLKPILDLHPPSYPYRMMAFLDSLHGEGSTRKWMEEGRGIFGEKLDSLRKRIGVVTSSQAFEGSVIGAWVNMKGLGLNGLVNSILRIAAHDISAAAVWLEIYHDILCAPVTTCLGGSHTTNGSYLLTFGGLTCTTSAHTGDLHSTGAFPLEVGKLLAERYELVRPRSLSQALDVYPDFEEARAALQAATDLVRSGSDEVNETNATEALSRAFRDLQEIHRRKKSYQTLFQVLAVTGAAATGTAGNAIGLIGALGFGLLGTNVAETIAEPLARIGMPKNILTLYDFEGKVSKEWTSKIVGSSSTR